MDKPKYTPFREAVLDLLNSDLTDKQIKRQLSFIIGAEVDNQISLNISTFPSTMEVGLKH